MEDDVKKLLEEQGKVLEEIRTHTHALHRALMWNRIWDTVRFLLFVLVPITLVYLYVLPAYQKYTDSMHAVQQGQKTPAQFLSELPPLFKALLPLSGVDVKQLEQQAQQQQQRPRK